MQKASWIDDRLPEMIWGVLLSRHLGREMTLTVFRGVASLLDGRSTLGIRTDVGHSGLAALPLELAKDVIRFICSAPGARNALRPLLLLHRLPLLDIWRAELGDEDPESDWDMLRIAVAHAFFHQSQEATDCRWMRVLAVMVCSKFHLPSREMAEEIFYYPNRGEQERVRPMIRAMEMSFTPIEGELNASWAKDFWAQCLTDTRCIALRQGATMISPDGIGTTLQKFRAVKQRLLDHSSKTLNTTGGDARHESMFGISLYGLAILEELLRSENSKAILARHALRTLLELHITARYLAIKNDEKLWKSYLAYGYGQAKLAFLKIDDEEAKQVGFIDATTLNEIANESASMEFVEINIGHWEKSNLRQMSEEAKVKADYDRYYPWTSAYVHGNWAAVRSATYSLCLNSLHRAHLIPSPSLNPLNDVLVDACSLMDCIFTTLNMIFPGFDEQITVSEHL